MKKFILNIIFQVLYILWFIMLCTIIIPIVVKMITGWTWTDILYDMECFLGRNKNCKL